MSELQVTLRYRYLPARIAFILLMCSTPIWALGAPVLFGTVIGVMLPMPNMVPLMIPLTVCPAALMVILAGLGATTIVEDNRLCLSKNGISFPLFMANRLGGRRSRNWNELLEAKLSLPLDAKGKENPHLSLILADGKSLTLKLRNFDQAGTEQLLLGIEVWANQCKRSPELIEFQHEIQNKSQGLDKIGYTQMWEEELSRRFQSTSFIPLEPGEVLHNGRLKVIRQLAFGGLSAIYLAQENESDVVVLKEAVVPQSADPSVRAEAEKHLARESEMLARLKHPKIAQVLDHFVDRGRHYLKLEYINGTDLRQYVRQNGPVDQLTAMNWGLQILEILQTLHTQDPPIIHRDLTPENLVLAKEAITLIDFGAANQFVGVATGTIVGKQAYMPPEQLRGKSSIQSDIYAFGGTMHFLLTGADPLPLSVSRPKKLAPQISDELDNLIARCSEFEPIDRCSSADEVSQAIAVLKGQ
jgi:tRNA A-37 threonylcarbamoyl transferase component Bud32